MKFVIFHGSFGSPKENWFPYLKTQLEAMGQTVIAPQFPVDPFDEKVLSKKGYKPKQNLNAWLEVFDSEVWPQLKNSDEKIGFIGHSLGNLFILHILDRYDLKLDSAIFVSPFLDLPTDIEIPQIFNLVNNTFYKTDFDFEKIRNKLDISYTLYSDTDPYVPTHVAKHFIDVMHSSPILVKKASHFNSEINLTEFPLIFDLCASRLDFSLLQRFIYKSQQRELMQGIINAQKQVIEATPELIAEEGMFHGDNLEKSGFATFITNAKDWEAQQVYYDAIRTRAQEGIPITRVFVVVDPKDLQRPLLRKQILDDFNAGIDVRLIDYTDYQTIGCPDDFGIWDNQYICIQHIDEQGELAGGIFDSRVKTLLTAQNWRDRIMRMSTKLTSMEQLDEWGKSKREK